MCSLLRCLGLLRAVRRLVGEVLRLSDPVRTQFQPLLCAWHDASGGEVGTIHTSLFYVPPLTPIIDICSRVCFATLANRA